MAEWFRPVFARAKTPILSSSFQSTDPFPSFSEDGSDEPSLSHRLSSASRLPAFLAPRLADPFIPNLVPADPFPNLLDPDNAFNPPSVDQIAESLKVMVMTQGVLSPIPIHYNASVLHLLEAYQEMRRAKDLSETRLQELESQHAMEIQEFNNVKTQWREKEQIYLKEVKRLEVVISQTEGGVEAMLVARSKSVINNAQRGSPASSGIDSTTENVSDVDRTFQIVRKWNKSGAIGNTDEEQQREFSVTLSKPSEPAVQPIKNSIVPYDYSSPISQAVQREKREIFSRLAWTRSSKKNLKNKEPCNHSAWSRATNSQELTANAKMSRLEVLERERATSSASSNNSSSTSSFSQNNDQIEQGGFVFRGEDDSGRLGGYGGAMKKEPKPKYSTGDFLEVRALEPDFQSKSHLSRHVGFSYQPGDDTSLQMDPTINLNRERLEDYLQQQQPKHDRKITSDLLPPQSNAFGLPSTPQKKKGIMARRPYNDSSETISREDSTSSVVTAVRDNSGRNSATGTVRRIKPPRDGRLSRYGSVGSSEALTAAARAFGANNKMQSTPSLGSREEVKEDKTRHRSEGDGIETKRREKVGTHAIVDSGQISDDVTKTRDRKSYTH